MLKSNLNVKYSLKFLDIILTEIFGFYIISPGVSSCLQLGVGHGDGPHVFHKIAVFYISYSLGLWF